MASNRTPGRALLAAIDVFRELGWPGATVDEAATLPIGTDQQQATALNGLRTGTWLEFEELWDDPASDLQGGDCEKLLSLFAVRVGVSASRARKVLTGMPVMIPANVIAEVVATRGAEFAGEFVAAAQDGRRWLRVDPAAVRPLVARFDLPIPRNTQYAFAWSRAAARELGLDSPRDEDAASSPDVSQHRFAEHVEAAIEVDTEPQPLAKVMAAGARGGRIERDRVVELAVSALETATRTQDRTAWANALADDLEIAAAGLVAHTDQLIQAMAQGPAVVVDRLAPRLITTVDDQSLTDVLTIALNAKTKKAQRAALDAAATRPGPAPATLDAVDDLLAEHAASSDRAIAKAAQAVLDAWGASPTPVVDEPVQARGLWQPTPPVWDVPTLELPSPTPDAVLDILGTLLRRPEDGIDDVETERFLALAQQFAYANASLAQETLSSLDGDESGRRALRAVRQWGTGERYPDQADGEPALARMTDVSPRFDSLPCLLSTPTWVDLRISPADLASRLDRYAAAGVAACEGDLWMALTRLDVALATDDDRRVLAGLTVELESGSVDLRGINAAQIALAYLDDPIREPASPEDPFALPAWLAILPNRLTERGWRVDVRTAHLFPTWPLPSSELTFDLHTDAGLRFRQLARRATPFPTALANRLLEAQHAARPGALPDARAALVEAWERGLLPPGVITVDPKPSAIAAKAAVLLDVSEDGLASLAWDVLDQLTTAAADVRSVPAGTVEAVEALRTLLPEAHAAVAAQVADPRVLELSGVRQLAERSGSAKAVVAARELVKELPLAA